MACKPLTRDEIKFTFNINELKVGDVLIINHYESDLAKRIGTKYTHVAIYMGEADVIESDGAGVTMNHVFSYGFKEHNDAVVLRYPDLTDEQAWHIIHFCRCEMGKEWDGLQMRKVPKYKDTDEPDTSNHTFCSRLVAQAYDTVGIKLVNNPNFCAPLDIKESSQLQEVENGLVETNDTLVRTILVQQSGRLNENDINPLAEIFSHCNSIYGKDIQRWDQLMLQAIAHPEKDEEVIAAIEGTGYFNYTEKLKKSYPWLWDYESFLKKEGTFNDLMWHILCQIKHFENRYLPCNREMLNALDITCRLYPNSKICQYTRKGFEGIFKSNVNFLNRVYELHILLMEKYPDDFKKFAETLHEETL